MASYERIQGYMNQVINRALNDFMQRYGEYVGDSDDLDKLVDEAVQNFIDNSSYFE